MYCITHVDANCTEEYVLDLCHRSQLNEVTEAENEKNSHFNVSMFTDVDELLSFSMFYSKLSAFHIFSN